jgi:hypothetical protein
VANLEIGRQPAHLSSVAAAFRGGGFFSQPTPQRRHPEGCAFCNPKDLNAKIIFGCLI